jgi:hypothetical protein
VAVSWDMASQFILASNAGLLAGSTGLTRLQWTLRLLECIGKRMQGSLPLRLGV